MKSLKSTLTAAAAALTMAGALAASTTQAEARWGRNAFIGGIFGGLVLGGLVHGAYGHPYYRPYGYYRPRPYWGAHRYAYARCHVRHRRVVGAYGPVWRPVRVCG